MRQRTSDRRGISRKALSVLAASAIFSGMLVFVAQPSSAAVTKDISAVCIGADEASAALVNQGLGGPVQAPLQVVSDVPNFVAPGATGVPVSLAWSLNLSTDLVNKAVGFGISDMTVSNVVLNTDVTGPTSTKVIPGTPPTRTVTLVKDQALSASFDPFTGTLNDIGDSGVIKLNVGKLTFTITLNLGGPQTINLTCDVNTTIAAIPVKVAGSPDITQPIEVAGTPGQNVTVDVLGQSVKPGTSKDGVTRPVDPSSLKVVDGPGTVSGGKLLIPSPAAGAKADTTFEVCAGQVETLAADPGSSETQEILLSFDQPNSFLRKPIGMSLKFGSEATDVIWTAQWPNNVWVSDPKPTDWKKVAGNYLPTHTVFPPADDIENALEALPGIGEGNVVVTETVRGRAKKGDPDFEALGVNKDRVRYQVQFINKLGNQDVPQIGVESYNSILPQEDLDALLAKATELLKPAPVDPNAPPPPPDPYANMTADEMFALADALWLQGPAHWEESWDVRLKAVAKKLSEPDTQAALLAFITGIWPPKPNISTPVSGVNPTAAQTQALCSQGVVTVSSTGTSVAGATTVPGSGTDGTTGAKLSFTG